MVVVVSCLFVFAVSPDVVSVVLEMCVDPSASVAAAAPFLHRVAVVPETCCFPSSSVAPSAPFLRHDCAAFVVFCCCVVVASPDVLSVVPEACDDPSASGAVVSGPRPLPLR